MTQYTCGMLRLQNAKIATATRPTAVNHWHQANVLPLFPLSPSTFLCLPSLLPSSPSFSVPLHSLPRSGPLNPARGSGTGERRPQKYFGYILSPEIVSGGNDFRSFFVLSNKYTQGLQVRITQCYLQITPMPALIPNKRSPVGASMV